ncbi:MAG: hypothetical protein ACFFCE_04965 [Promethearchaeota archaeon]
MINSNFENIFCTTCLFLKIKIKSLYSIAQHSEMAAKRKENVKLNSHLSDWIILISHV